MTKAAGLRHDPQDGVAVVVRSMRRQDAAEGNDGRPFQLPPLFAGDQGANVVTGVAVDKKKCQALFRPTIFSSRRLCYGIRVSFQIPFRPGRFRFTRVAGFVVLPPLVAPPVP